MTEPGPRPPVLPASGRRMRKGTQSCTECEAQFNQNIKSHSPVSPSMPAGPSSPAILITCTTHCCASDLYYSIRSAAENPLQLSAREAYVFAVFHPWLTMR